MKLIAVVDRFGKTWTINPIHIIALTPVEAAGLKYWKVDLTENLGLQIKDKDAEGFTKLWLDS